MVSRLYLINSYLNMTLTGFEHTSKDNIWKTVTTTKLNMLR